MPAAVVAHAVELNVGLDVFRELHWRTPNISNDVLVCTAARRRDDGRRPGNGDGGAAPSTGSTYRYLQLLPKMPSACADSVLVSYRPYPSEL